MIGRICVVADRGMISTETVARSSSKLLYLLGTRRRTDKVVRDVVLADSAPCVPLTITKRGHEIDYEAKAVTVGGRRYILCRNHQEAERDAAAARPSWPAGAQLEGRQATPTPASASSRPKAATSPSTPPRRRGRQVRWRRGLHQH
jgi:hypothetical protein